jgi:hypothetical protein
VSSSAETAASGVAAADAGGGDVDGDSDESGDGDPVGAPPPCGDDDEPGPNDDDAARRGESPISFVLRGPRCPRYGDLGAQGRVLMDRFRQARLRLTLASPRMSFALSFARRAGARVVRALLRVGSGPTKTMID